MSGTEQLASLAVAFKDVSPVSYVFAFFLLSLLPWAFLSLTSFLKISVVLSILRNALGANGIPSGAITSLLAIALTLHIMSPTFTDIATGVQTGLNQVKPSARDGERLIGALEGARTPLLAFLAKHSHPKQRSYFREQALSRNIETIESNEPKCVEELNSGICLFRGESLTTLVPAFIFSELSKAFSLGFLIFLPFLIVDILVAVVLVGMGMTMLNPVSISLPLKLLLLVAADGWFEFGRALVSGYS
jgi:type III secretion protein R